MTPHNKGKKISEAQRKKISDAMKKSYAERKAKYGKPKRKSKGLDKWRPGQLEKFRATMAARRKAREAAANGSGVAANMQMIPLHAIPERHPTNGTRKPYTRKADREHAPDNRELAKDLLQIAVALLKGKL